MDVLMGQELNIYFVVELLQPQIDGPFLSIHGPEPSSN